MASQLRKETHSWPSLTHTNCLPRALYAVCRHATFGFNNDWLFLVSKWRQTLDSWVTVCPGIQQQQELLWINMM